MDPKNRRLLQHHQQDIVNDLDVSYILDDLFTKNVISNEDFDHIYNLSNRVERARYLIDKLLQYGTNNSYEAFVDSLAKDYKWLWEKLAVEANDQIMNDSFEDSLSRGDVPRLPEHHVKRELLERTVAMKLKDLSRHKILALHGMSGCGKTCVAISVLRDNPELITNNFNGVVFWMNFGTCKTEDDIVAQQNKLLRKISSMYLNNSYMITSISMSSIASNGDSSLSNYDYNWLDLRDTLKSQFLEQPIKEALLVLDEVNERKCLEAFDIGCKILITTRDTEVVACYGPVIINIDNSFKEKESLELFASYLEMSVSKLPSQAKKLNEICKGNPFQLALIGAQLAENKDRLKYDPGHWKYYVNKLEKKDFFFLWKTNDKPMKTIALCINSLNENMLLLYKRLAVLPDNVKISARVLSKLWNKELTEVESILKKLRSKSLIIETYDREHKNYLYEVQDLIMNYLRSTINEEDTKKLHSEFLNSYHYDNVNTVSAELLDDGYIAYYIGYHILNTKNMHQKWGLFNKLFLDLKFLGNKVRLTGPDDVMLDLQKYENYIAKDDLDRDLIYNIKAFLSAHGTDLYHYPCTDIIQSILQHVSTGILYTKASLIAQGYCDKNELYFEFMHELDVEELKHSTIDVKESITSVCFLGNHVIVGTTQGLIKFFHIPTNKLKKELSGTGSPIKWIGVVCSQNPPIVAALATDGIIKLWYVDDVDQDVDTDTIEEEPEEAYNNNYPSSVTIDPGFGAFLNCRWTNNEDVLVTHTARMVIMCQPTGERLNVIDNFERDRELMCCVPCDNDRYIAVATSNGIDKYVEVIDRKTKERLVIFEETDFVKDMIVVPGTNKIITLKNNEISEHEFIVKASSIDKSVFCKSRSVITGDAVKINLSFTSIVVNKTGMLLFVSTDDSRVVCVDTKTHTRVFDIENRRGNVIAMAVSEVLLWDEFEPGSDVLLTGTDTTENSAKVWYLDPSYISQTAHKTGKVRLTTMFDASFLNAPTPNSPISSSPNSGTESSTSTPKRHQSFANHKEVSKKILKNSMSLDRNMLKLNLKGICNNNESIIQPLLAVVDDKNNIQVIRGRKVLGEILEKSEEHITIVKISPCNHHVFYGLSSGEVKKYTLRTKELTTILDVYSPVQYLNFVNANLLMVAGKNRCLMAYRFNDEDWKPEMLQRGNTYLGSQELLNEFQRSKKINGQSDKVSTSSSESSIESRDRLFRSGDIKSLCRGSGLIDCFWINDTGLLTVEYNASIKLWNRDLKVSTILYARHTDVHISCAAFQKNTLVICDSDNKRFQTFHLKTGLPVELNTIQEYKLNNVITSCDLSSDGYILALGLDSGNVVIWNVKAKRQIALLKHHKTKVQSCSFSPVPERMPCGSEAGEDQPPLVLVTMASEIVWWNITYIIKTRSKTVWKSGWNAMTPAGTPLENRSAVQSPTESSSPERPNFFFNDGLFNQHCWKFIWKGKTFKEGSKRKEILACIKLSGVNAKKLCHDARFSCFVTVDNPGHVHVMNMMKSSCL